MAKQIAADLGARVAPRLVEKDAVLPDGGEPEVRRVTADRVHPCPRGHERRRRVEPERAAAAVLADRAADRRELGPEVARRERAARLLRPADVVDAVERDEVEKGLGLGPVDEREKTDRKCEDGSAEAHPAHHTLHRRCHRPGAGASWQRAAAVRRPRMQGREHARHAGTDEEPRLARVDGRGAARPRAADLRPASPPVGPTRRPRRSTLPARRDPGGHRRRSQCRVHRVHRVRSHVEDRRAGGPAPRRRDGVRERDRGDERLRRLWPVARRRRHRGHGEPAARRGRGRRARRSDRRRRRPVPRHPPRARPGIPIPPCPITGPARRRGCSCATISARDSPSSRRVG